MLQVEHPEGGEKWGAFPKLAPHALHSQRREKERLVEQMAGTGVGGGSTGGRELASLGTPRPGTWGASEQMEPPEF